MARIVCRTCGTVRDLPHLALYSPVHIFPGIIFSYCPKCRRYRLHRKADPSAEPKDDHCAENDDPTK